MTAEQIRLAMENKLEYLMEVKPQLASDDQLYKAAALVLRDLMVEKRRAHRAKTTAERKKRIHYLSMEFLMGKSLKNSLYNLGLVEPFTEALTAFGTTPERLFACEPDPGLGNGGLGRLAACYLDGMATDGYYGTGYSILYEYGIFKQKLVNGAQTELPDYWLPGGEVWLRPNEEHAVEVKFGGRLEEHWDQGHLMQQYIDYETVLAVPYNMYVSGYDTEAVSVLRLWKAKSPGIDMECFNNGDYLGAFRKTARAETISKILYPNDNHQEGKQLRLRQQYFLVCASLAEITRTHMERYGTMDSFAELNAIQLNDTHPTLAIPELMRILMDDCGYSWEKSWEITEQTFAYTNHTVMAEALEKWDITLFRELLPRIYQIVQEIDRRWNIRMREEFRCDNAEVEKMQILRDGKVHMANLCVVGGHYVNGVSKLHSQIIKDDVFHEFYRLMPEKFGNVTNGIASRRWLMQSNPRLDRYIRDRIGEEYLHNFDLLTGLRAYLDDEASLRELGELKRQNKADFARYLQTERGITVNPDSLFYVQVKRLHEYKRQHLNALQILKHYLDIKANPDAEFKPRTYLFGAKAAPGYDLAKKIIRFINDLGAMIDADPDVRSRLKIVYLEEYNVSMSERLMPASEVSEQISLAGTEASGTGNMKLMQNGAITLGTMDGANVEIAEQVGPENILIFGMSTPEVEEMKQRGYRPADAIARSGELQRLLEFMERQDSPESFWMLANHLRTVDQYMAAADFESYSAADDRAAELYYNDPLRWQRMSLANIAGAGIFCADRAIHDYARDIWHLD
mgnify:FL=1